MNENQAIGLLVITLIVLVVVFIVTRVFWLWYWKIYEVVSLLKQIRDSLRGLERASLVHAPTPSTVSEPAPAQVLTSTPEHGRRVRATRQSALRTEPDPNAEITGRVESGAWLNVLTTQPGWIWVQTDDGAEGWLQLPGQLS